MRRFLERLNLISGRDTKETMRPIKPNRSLFSLVLTSSLGELKRLSKYQFFQKSKMAACGTDVFVWAPRKMIIWKN